jgi:hypothetical protein
MRGRQLLQQPLPRRAAGAVNLVAYWLLTCPRPPGRPAFSTSRRSSRKRPRRPHTPRPRRLRSTPRPRRSVMPSPRRTTAQTSCRFLSACPCVRAPPDSRSFSIHHRRGPADESRFGPCATLCVLRVLCDASPLRLRSASPDGVPVSRIMPR